MTSSTNFPIGRFFSPDFHLAAGCGGAFFRRSFMHMHEVALLSAKQIKSPGSLFLRMHIAYTKYFHPKPPALDREVGITRSLAKSGRPCITKYAPESHPLYSRTSRLLITHCSKTVPYKSPMWMKPISTFSSSEPAFGQLTNLVTVTKSFCGWGCVRRVV